MIYPDCAICSQPALVECDCEEKELDIAVRQAEQRMMNTVFNDIREWVCSHAQTYILNYFSMLEARRKEKHARQIQQLTESATFYYHARPHPSEIAHVDAELKHGIDEDWRASVQRYPEVLEYFYSLVELSLPSDNDTCVRDPRLSALSGVAGGGRITKLRMRDGSEMEERLRRRRSRASSRPAERATSVTVVERDRERDRGGIMRPPSVVYSMGLPPTTAYQYPHPHGYGPR